MKTSFLPSMFLILLSLQYSFGQSILNKKKDTILLSRFDFVTLETNNGSYCICYIGNKSQSQSAIIVSIGAESQIKFEDKTPFNGVHILKKKEQIISYANFKGKNLIVSNLSPYSIYVIVMIICF